jgi:dipeptidyl aminopeptidase/acylaminoacyl peptidase
MRTFSLLAITVVINACLAVAGAQTRRTPGLATPADLLRVATVGDAQISPNGQWVVYTVSTVAGDETVNTLWLARLVAPVRIATDAEAPSAAQRTTTAEMSSGPPLPLLAPGWKASNPRWSPDSTSIAFVGNRDNLPGLWVVNLEHREPRFVAPIQNTNFFITYAGESLAWSPDSKRIAYISATDEPNPTDLAAAPNDDPRVIDRIQYKSRTSFSDNRRTHVWISAIEKPEPRQLTSGAFYDHALTFSPEGNEIAFVSNHEPDPDANNNSDIFAVDLNGEVRQITATRGCEYEPAWSPDGKRIAYTATKRDVTTIDSVAEDAHVWVMQADGSGRIELSLGLDRRARSPHWSRDGKWVFFLANDRGLTRIFRVDLARAGLSGSEGIPGFPSVTAPLVRDNAGNSVALPWPSSFQINSFSLSLNSQSSAPTVFACTLSDWQHPAEVWTGILGREEALHRVSGHNFGLIQGAEPEPPEQFWFKSFDGLRVQGWLLKPAGWREDRKYPMILSIHGGPHGMYGWAFNPTFQIYAARGYAVVYLNPRGSNGYGQKFSDGTLNEWGGGDYRDLMLGVDEALRKYPWVDRDRLGVTGGSYGGFMTNWIITQTPRFKAAVSLASVSNLISFYSTSLYQDLIHAEFGGFPWDNYEQLWQWSPLRYVRQAQTPTLFIHGEQDNDVHITQAEEMFTALKRRGVETVFVRYPREGHGLREPRHRVDALERTLAWFDRFLK